MEFLRLVADDYESAVVLARKRFGSAVRIHSRRDIDLGRKGSRCEITYYLVDLSQQQRFKSEQHLLSLLKANGIDSELPMVATLLEGCKDWQESEVEMHLIEALLGKLNYSYGFTHQKLIVRGSEANRTAVKLAATLQSREGKRVALLQTGEEPTIAEELAELWNIPTCRSEGEEAKAFDYLISLEESDQEDAHTITSIAAKVLSAEDESPLAVDAVVIRDFDQVTVLGPLVLALTQRQLPIGYIDRDFSSDEIFLPASATHFLEKLKGFRLDLSALSF